MMDKNYLVIRKSKYFCLSKCLSWESISTTPIPDFLYLLDS